MSTLSPADPDRIEKAHQLKSETAYILVNIGKQRLIFVERKKLYFRLNGKDRTPKTGLSPLEDIKLRPLRVQLDDVRHNSMINTYPIQRLAAQWHLPKNIEITHVHIQLSDQLEVRLEKGRICLMPCDIEIEYSIRVIERDLIPTLTFRLRELTKLPLVRLKPYYGKIPKVLLIAAVHASSSSNINKRKRVIEDGPKRFHALAKTKFAMASPLLLRDKNKITAC